MPAPPIFCMDGASAHLALPGGFAFCVILLLVPSNGQCGDEGDGPMLLLLLWRMPSPLPLAMDTNEDNDDGNGEYEDDNDAPTINDDDATDATDDDDCARPMMTTTTMTTTTTTTQPAPPPGLSTAAARRETDAAVVLREECEGRMGKPRRKQRRPSWARDVFCLPHPHVRAAAMVAVNVWCLLHESSAYDLFLLSI